MKRCGTIVLCLILLQLNACSLFETSDHEHPVKLAQQLLTAQEDKFGDPIPVRLPVQVNYTIARKPQIDRDMRIKFQFIAQKAIPILRLGLTTSDGLELVDSELEPRYNNLKPRQSFSKVVTVEPTSENEFYLNLFVVTEAGKKQLAKQIKIPIAVGRDALKNLGARP